MRLEITAKYKRKDAPFPYWIFYPVVMRSVWIRKEFLMKIARKTFNHLVTQCKGKNLLKKAILISTMSSVEPLREVVQTIGAYV